MSTSITLETHEVMLAAGVGVRRHVSALRGGLRDQHGFAGDGWGVHVEGACGEMAVAKLLNLYWNGSVDTFKDFGDVGALQVRTRSRHHYDLIVRRNDRGSDRFVLVTGTCPNFVVRGYIAAGEAQSHPEWLQKYGDREPAFFVPQVALHDLGAELRVA